MSNPPLSSSYGTTQMRAIHTPLTSRPVPSIPPPTQTYIPLVKQILQHRLVRHVFTSSFISCWVLAVLWGVSKAGAQDSLLLTPLRVNTILGGLMLWAVLAVPEVVLRKRFLTSKLTKAASPKESVTEARKLRRTKIAFGTYLVSALVFLVFHIAFVEEGDKRLKLFVQSRKHPFYLNPRFLFLFFSQTVAALVYAIRTILVNRFVFKLSQPPTPSQRILTLPTFLQTALTTLLLSLFTLPLTSALFFLSRLVLLPLLYHLPVPFLARFLKLFTAHLLRTHFFSLSHPISSLLHFALLPITYRWLLARALAIAYTTLFTWEIASTLFTASVSQPIKVSHLVSDPNVVLVSGISISSYPQVEDGFPYHYTAYLELRDLASAPASDSPQAAAQRAALFSDQKYTPSLWSRLVRESLLILGRDYRLLVHRGNPPPTPPSPPAAGPIPAAPSATTPATPAKPATDLPFQTTPIKLMSQPSAAFKPPKPSPVKNAVDSLASDGPLAKAVELVGEEAEMVVNKVPELFRSVRSAVRPAIAPGHAGSTAVVPATTSKGNLGFGSFSNLNPAVLVTRANAEVRKRVEAITREVIGVVPGWIKAVGSEVYEWWTRERVHRKVEMAVVNKELDLVVVDVLSHLVCASLTEDKFGVVQRDIPKILEAFVRFLGEVDGWRAQLSAPSPSSDQDQNQDSSATQQLMLGQARAQQELDAAKALLSELSDGLKEGIGRIVRTFGDKLTAFKFPPVVAQSLQGFLDYCT